MTPFDRSHEFLFVNSVVDMAVSCIISEILVENCNFSFYMTASGGKCLRIFCAVFSQTSQIRDLSGGINRFCKTSSVYSELKRVTNRQTDRQNCDLNSGPFYIHLQNNIRIYFTVMQSSANWNKLI